MAWRKTLPFALAAALLAPFAACSSSEPQSAADAGDDSSAAPFDAGSGSDQAAAVDTGLSLDGCLPAPVSTFVAVGIHPLILPVCSDAQIQAFTQACLGPGPFPASCTSLLADSAFQACRTCLVTAYSLTPVTPGVNPVPPAWNTWGPLVSVSDKLQGVVDLGTAGVCVALADPTLASCGQSLNALLQCQVTACAANCALPRGGESPDKQLAERDAFLNCMGIALTSGCAALATSCVEKVDASAASFCTELGKSPDAFAKFARLTCGMPQDAGGAPDAADAADGG